MRQMDRRPDELDEIRWRMRIANLEARVELCEIESAALAREIASPLTAETCRSQAMMRRSVLLTEASEFKTELEQIRRSFPTWARH